MKECDMGGCGLKFRRGAKVELNGVKNLSGWLDFSECESMKLVKCDFSKVDGVCFRDMAQMRRCGGVWNGFAGKVIFSDAGKETERSAFNLMRGLGR